MKKILVQLWMLLLLAVLARGEFVFDQQSVTNDAPDEHSLVTDFPTNIVYGQSFIPSLSLIDKVELILGDAPGRGDGGATVSVDLWSGGIGTGTLEGSAQPVYIPVSFSGYTNFFFSTPVTLTPSDTYFLAVSQAGNDIISLEETFNNYPDGVAYVNGTSQPVFDLWFREGATVVPEPSTIPLVLCGAAGLFFSRRRN